MLNKVWTLTGYTENPVVAIDILLSNYFKALKSTSTIIPSEIRSLLYDINTGKSIGQIETNIKTSIEYIFKDYFTESTVNVIISKPDSMYAIQIQVSVKDNGANFNVAKLVNATDTRIAKLVDISHKGVR